VVLKIQEPCNRAVPTPVIKPGLPIEVSDIRFYVFTVEPHIRKQPCITLIDWNPLGSREQQVHHQFSVFLIEVQRPMHHYKVLAFSASYSRDKLIFGILFIL
jgi:hypothetical protein